MKIENRTRASVLIGLADKYTTRAMSFLTRGELDLALFYRNAAKGILARLEALSVAECCERL